MDTHHQNVELREVAHAQSAHLLVNGHRLSMGWG